MTNKNTMKTETKTTTENRSQETMSKDFFTRPGDVFTIVSHEGTISSTIAVRVTNENTGEDFHLGLKNELKAWKLLKTLSDFRSVIYERHTYEGEIQSCNYTDSAPFLHRFPR